MAHSGKVKSWLFGVLPCNSKYNLPESSSDKETWLKARLKHLVEISWVGAVGLFASTISFLELAQTNSVTIKLFCLVSAIILLILSAMAVLSQFQILKSLPPKIAKYFNDVRSNTNND